MGSLDGKVALVTGANTGIGRVTAEELGALGARVLLAGRSEARTAPVAAAIRARGGAAELLPLDLGDLDSVRACAAAALERAPSLDLLVNNAGLAGARGVTRQGFELAFGTNHVGHYLLTRLLLPALARPAAARVVTVASTGHYRAPGIDWEAVRQPTRSRTAFPEYCVSKLANVLFSAELARRAPPSIHTYSLHPGGVASDVWREVPWGLRHVMKLFMLTNEQGARTSLHCAASVEAAGETGLYYDRSRPRRPSALARDAELSRELWERSATWVDLPA